LIVRQHAWHANLSTTVDAFRQPTLAPTGANTSR